MAHLTHRDMRFKLDNASGTLTDLSGDVNSQSLESAIDMLEDTGMGEEDRTYLPGLAGRTIPLNGMHNTTTDGIFGPAVISDNTTATKTFEFRAYANRFYNGEALISNFALSGSRDTLETWSCTLQITGAVNRTTVALS